MAASRVRALLMGGQACVFYGAAEFSRDTDLLILADSDNLERLGAAVAQLKAERIAVPPFERKFLDRGLAVHFRCRHPDASEMRIDVMSKLRGVEPFPILWERRTTIADEEGLMYELLSLPDLVQAKKTQRGKDWPMLRRLLEAHYLQHRSSATSEQQRFWLLEMRTPEFLVEIVQNAPEMTEQLEQARPLLALARAGRGDALDSALSEEEHNEREADRRYWQPLKAELERLRREAREH